MHCPGQFEQNICSDYAIIRLTRIRITWSLLRWGLDRNSLYLGSFHQDSGDYKANAPGNRTRIVGGVEKVTKYQEQEKTPTTEYDHELHLHTRGVLDLKSCHFCWFVCYRLNVLHGLFSHELDGFNSARTLVIDYFQILHIFHIRIKPVILDSIVVWSAVRRPPWFPCKFTKFIVAICPCLWFP